jgi:hypothetical protein
MSDLQDLIHKTSIDCIEKGQRMERERIIKLLEDWKTEFLTKEDPNGGYRDLLVDSIVARVINYDIKLIKGETK